MTPSQREDRKRRSGGRDVIVEAPGARDKFCLLVGLIRKRFEFSRGICERLLNKCRPRTVKGLLTF